MWEEVGAVGLVAPCWEGWAEKIGHTLTWGLLSCGRN